MVIGVTANTTTTIVPLVTTLITAALRCVITTPAFRAALLAGTAGVALMIAADAPFLECIVSVCLYFAKTGVMVSTYRCKWNLHRCPSLHR